MRDLIEKSGDAADTSIADDDEIGALDRAVGALRAQSPGKADVVAEAVGLADQLEAEIRKALLHPGDQRVDPQMIALGFEPARALLKDAHGWPVVKSGAQYFEP